MRRRLRLLALSGAAICGAARADESHNPAAAAELPTVEVIGTTPLPGLGTPLRQVPANVQSATASDLEARQSLDLPDFLNHGMSGVMINEVAGNPFQPDVLFRGFSASPLLGTPEGISVYQDGVRVNEAFGDVVNWDLIPQSAISTITLVPGSNPTFGLNTLGGALSIQTKSGSKFPGFAAQAYGGSFGRRAAELELGGSHQRFDYFLAGNLFHEDGWRDNSPSRLRQLFGKVGWENDTSDLDLSYTLAGSDLAGNGFTPQAMLAQRRQSVFTPDSAANRLNFVNLSASHFLDDQLLLAGDAYLRRTDAQTFNGDINDGYQDAYAALVAPGGACAGAADPDACAAAALATQTARNNATRTRQNGYGMTAQLTYTGRLARHKNQLTAGLAFDGSRSDFTQTGQDASFTPQRDTVATGPQQASASFTGSTRNYGVYLTDGFAFSPAWHLTISGRYNHTGEQLRDRLGTALTGSHGFTRLNPAAGLNYTPSPALTAYLSYNEGSRAATPIELGCSDPTTPCKLPNSFAADPPLQQVVARTWEAGARGKLGWGGLQWSAAVYRTTNDNDIQFISSTISGAGFFDNVGRTRRQGAELGLSGALGRLSWRGSYAFVDATYRTPLSLVSEDNSAADANGFIRVQPGDRLPGISRNSFKLGGDYAILDNWSAGLDLVAFSGQFVRGNEDNAHRQGGAFLGPGRVGGYAVVDLDSRYRFARYWELFAKISNLLDRSYATTGVLGSNPFDHSGRFQPNPADWTQDTAFVPGAPRAAWIGVRYAWAPAGRRQDAD